LDLFLFKDETLKMEQIAVIWRETFADEMTGRRQAFLGFLPLLFHLQQ
jgi:hypothetical protein